ncbi:MAG: hypothetical protein E7426_05845 [Ruminococcaceae bacterium]|jgi:hypothetical protein|nr:hypothetical protein [Oscillospiraceae bacterium]
MWEDKNYQDGAVEINLMDLFWSVLRYWKVIVAATLIAGIVLGGYGGIKEYGDLANEKVVKARQEAYDSAMETYQLTKEQLETDLQNLRDDLERQQFYTENAVMLFVDQYNVYVRTASYYINTNYEISPNLYFQNPDYTSVITKSYRAALNRLDLDTVIATAKQPDLTVRNPVSSTKKLLTASTDDGNGILNITVLGDTQERVDAIFAAVEKTLAEQEALLNKVIGEHSISVLSAESYTDTDTEFGELQEEFKAKMESITDGIEDTNKKLDELKEPVNETPTMKTVIRRGVKFGVIGLVLGLCVSTFFYLVRTILQDRLNSTEEILRRYRTPVLGVVTDEKKRLRLDTFLARKLGMEAGEAGAENYIAANVRLYLKEGRKVLLIGSCGADRLGALKDKLTPLLEGIELQVGGNVNESPSAVDALRRETAVVCVEKWLATSHREIRHELRAVKDSGNTNLGFVVVQ